MILAPDQKPLTEAALSDAAQKVQKQILRARLFSLIHQMQPVLARKITRMLLELDNTEILNMLESPDSLKAKVRLRMNECMKHAK